MSETALGEERVKGLVPKNGHLYYQFQIHGRTFSGSLHMTDTPRNRVKAEFAIEELRKEARDWKSAPKAIRKVLRFGEAAQMFVIWLESEYERKSTVTTYKGHLTPLIQYFDQTFLLQIHEPEIEAYKFWRRTEHEIRDVTLRHDLHVLSVLFRWAKKFGFVRVNPFKSEDISIPSDKESVSERVVTLDEEQRYMRCAARLKIRHGRIPNLPDFSRLMIDQGMRPEEVQSLELSGFSSEARTIKILRGKTKAARRTLRLTQECFDILQRRAEVAIRAGSRWLFPSARKPGDHIGTMNQAHVKVCKMAGFECRLYDFRHTFATRAGLDKVDLPSLAMLMGHGNLNSLRRYIHPQQEQADRTMDERDRRKTSAKQELATKRKGK